MPPTSPPTPPSPPGFLPTLPSAVVGQVFRDHGVERVVEVVEALPDRLVVAQSHGGRYDVADGWLLLLEWLESPHLAALRFRAQQAGAQPDQSVRDALLALDPAERLVAVLRDQTEKAQFLEDGTWWVPRREALHTLAIQTETDDAAAEELVREGQACLAKATELRAKPGRLGRATGFLIDLAPRAEPLRQLLAGRRVARPRAPLLLRRASQRRRYSAAEEALLRWILQERMRLHDAAAADPVDCARRELLEATLDAVLMPAIERRIQTRPWPDPEGVALTVFQGLCPALAEAPDALEAAKRAQAVARLRAHLRGEPPRPGEGAKRTSQLLHNACWGLLDLERTSNGLRAAKGGRPVAVRALSPEVASVRTVVGPGKRASNTRTVAREEQVAPRQGTAELTAWIVARQPDPDLRLAEAQELRDAIRAAFAEAITPDLAHYRTYVLEFMSPVGRTVGARALGANENTVRGLFPRSGEKDDRKPHADVHRLVAPFEEDVRRFGRVFPILRFALLPFQHEVNRYATPEYADVLRALFTDPSRWTGRGETWPGWLLDRQVAALRALEPARDPAWDRFSLLREVVLPFLERVLEGRRAEGTERDLSWSLTSGRTRAQELHDALGWLLLGAPDGDALRHVLALLERPVREVAKAAGLSTLDLVDLQLGRRWATPSEVEGLVGALVAAAPDLPEVAARAALAPLVAPSLPPAPEPDDGADGAGTGDAAGLPEDATGEVDTTEDDEPELDDWLEPEGQPGDDPWSELQARPVAATVDWELAVDDAPAEEGR